MKILVTGATGQLGQEIRHILEAGFTDIGPVSHELLEADFTYCGKADLDISDKNAVQNIIIDHKFDIVINCAAFTNVDLAETRPSEAFYVNALGPKNLAIASQAIGAKLIHISTDYVFPGDNPKPRTEEDPCSPYSVYGATKLLGENYIKNNCDKYFIVRSAWLYSTYGRNFLNTILSIARSKKIIRVVHDQIGNPTYANDLAYVILKLILRDEYGTYHCTNQGECSWFEFASEIIHDTGIECEKIPCLSADYPQVAQRPRYSSLNVTRLENVLGEAMRPWQDALKSCLSRLNP